MRWALFGAVLLGVLACKREAGDDDKAFLVGLCGTARDACAHAADGEDGCDKEGCAAGYRGCLANLSDPPADWQPPDAFDDDCKAKSCLAACQAGSGVACRGSAVIVAKYGTRAYCD